MVATPPPAQTQASPRRAWPADLVMLLLVCAALGAAAVLAGVPSCMDNRGAVNTCAVAKGAR